jgi:group I intron endonuclease
MNGLIYIARHKESGRVYVGQTVRFEVRLKEHLRSPSYFGNVMRKYGIEAFDYTQMSYPVDWLDFWEAYWISNLNSLAPNGYNLTEGGRYGTRGRKATEESCKRMGATKIGNKYCIGRVMSEETRRKIGAPKIGHKHSPEHCAKISASLKGNKRCAGRVVPESTRLKMRMAALRRNNAGGKKCV